MPQIDRIWAFVLEDTGPGDEVVVSFGSWPMIGADQARVTSMRPVAQQIADQTRKPVKLLMFSVRTEVEAIVPYGQQRNGH